jgi:DNA-binding GntR family transcriptional regulator
MLAGIISAVAVEPQPSAEPAPVDQLAVLPPSTLPKRARAGYAAERAYATVKERLLGGDYHAGQRLSVDELRVELDVSKQPVMEALRLLHAENLVTIVPQVGCWVIEHAPADVADFFALMAAVEGQAAAIAAARRTPEQLTDLADLSARIGALRELEPGNERARAYRALNRRLHSVVHRMAGTAIVEELGSSLYDRADLFIYGATERSPMADAIADRHADHERIRAAIERGDAVAADTAGREHILGTVALIERARAREGRP